MELDLTIFDWKLNLFDIKKYFIFVAKLYISNFNRNISVKTIIFINTVETPKKEPNLSTFI